MFANGADSDPGGLAIVGEKGPELVNLPRGSQVLPNNQLASAMGGGNINVPVTVNIDATGADAAGLARVQQQVADLKANLPGLAVKAVRTRKIGG
jgi:phage-related tail protein